MPIISSGIPMVNLYIKLYYGFFRFENCYCHQVVKHLPAKKQAECHWP